MISGRFATLPYPIIDNGNKAQDRQGEGTALVGLGLSFRTAIGLTVRVGGSATGNRAKERSNTDDKPGKN